MTATSDADSPQLPTTSPDPVMVPQPEVDSHQHDVDWSDYHDDAPHPADPPQGQDDAPRRRSNSGQDPGDMLQHRGDVMQDHGDMMQDHGDVPERRPDSSSRRAGRSERRAGRSQNRTGRSDHRAAAPLHRAGLAEFAPEPPPSPPDTYPPGDDPPLRLGVPDAQTPPDPPESGGLPPILLVTADLGLMHRVEDLGESIGIPVTTVAAPPTHYYPWPALILVGHDLLGEMLHQFRDEVLGDRAADAATFGGIVAVGDCAVPPETWDRAARLGAETVAFLPGDEPWLVSRMLTAVVGPIPVGATVVGVTGGRGGAGATVLAAALARTAAGRGLNVVLIDADPLGGGVDLTLGAEDTPGVRWPDLQPARGVLHTGTLTSELPLIDGVRVVTWDRSQANPVPPEAMRAVVDAAIRMSDFVVIDLPRALDRSTVVAVQACTIVLLVVSADLQASVAAHRSTTLLRPWAQDIRLVVRGPAPGRLDPAAVARALDLPLVGWLDREPRLASALERGEPPALRKRGPLAAFCREIVADLTSPASAAQRFARRARDAR